MEFSNLVCHMVFSEINFVVNERLQGYNMVDYYGMQIITTNMVYGNNGQSFNINEIYRTLLIINKSMVDNVIYINFLGKMKTW